MKADVQKQPETTVWYCNPGSGQRAAIQGSDSRGATIEELLELPQYRHYKRKIQRRARYAKLFSILRRRK